MESFDRDTHLPTYPLVRERAPKKRLEQREDGDESCLAGIVVYSIYITQAYSPGFPSPSASRIRLEANIQISSIIHGQWHAHYC